MPLLPFGEWRKTLVDKEFRRMDLLDETIQKLDQMGPAHAARRRQVYAIFARGKEWFRKVAGYEFVGQYVDYGTSEHWANDYERRLFPADVQRAKAEQ